ncbi:MAG: family 16 glycosylhydrolase [Spirochaetales bacterium]|nr:family 16 glycosylhydrolase [Spirochaetales bacterium]
MFKRIKCKSLKWFVLAAIMLIVFPALLNAAEWAPYTYYSRGTVVTYQGPTYTCRQSHTSLPGWEPPNVPALWLSGGSSGTVATSTPTPGTNATATPSNTPASGNGAVFYQHINYGGTATQPIPPGNYTLSQLYNYGFVNDWASSCRTGGYTVVMYEHDNFTGTAWILSRDESWFGNLSPNANDLVSSVIIQTGTVTFTPTPTPNQGTSGALWADEFNGSGLPAWNFDLGGGGWGNAELETYTNSTANCNQSGGVLNITALNNGGYTSARIKSPYNRTYGRIEGRIKVPMGQGLWPAFWMLGTNIGSVGWPACGEIDIMEHINSEGAIYGTMHWDTGGYASYGGSVGCAPQNWNTYSILWDSSAIRWYINGAQYWEGNIAGNINGTEEFHRNFFIILNLAVGGNWPGSPNSSTAFPAVYQIDWVRWYAQ